MKKILLGSSAIVAAGLFSAPAIAADPIALSLGGYYRVAFYGVFSGDDEAAAATDHAGTANPYNSQPDANLNNSHMSTDGEVHFNGSTTLDNGIGVAVRVELEITDNGPGSTTDILDEHYITLSGGFGRIRMGNEDAIGNAFSAAAPLGADFFGVNSPTVVSSNHANNTVSNAGFNGTSITLGGDATGISYTTPNFAGFQLGVSWKPDGGSENTLQADGTNSSITGLGDVYSAGVSFAQAFGDISVTANLAGAVGELDGNSNVEYASEWQGGFSVSSFGFTLGGSYRHGESQAGNEGGTDDVWDVGLTYGTGPVTVGLAMSHGTYNRSTLTANGVGAAGAGSLHVVELGATYVLGPGVELQSAVNWTQWDTRQSDAASSIDARGTANDDYSGFGAGLALGLSF